ncbi:hypothetical protein BDN70DRAFT_995870 [Pholiota conissans]|uniref:Uncharacterized protein n=1 Tax=Pholiota conissans TaxID=109636 RepID=A0A9P5YUP0_9AGAR|nr:hypothetical protein BDN70DRAFT_995870 [Pholiota conissans]
MSGQHQYFQDSTSTWMDTHGYKFIDQTQKYSKLPAEMVFTNECASSTSHNHQETAINVRYTAPPFAQDNSDTGMIQKAPAKEPTSLQITLPASYTGSSPAIDLTIPTYILSKIEASRVYQVDIPWADLSGIAITDGGKVPDDKGRMTIAKVIFLGKRKENRNASKQEQVKGYVLSILHFR